MHQREMRQPYAVKILATSRKLRAPSRGFASPARHLHQPPPRADSTPKFCFQLLAAIDPSFSMSPALHHDLTRVPVTAIASCGPLLLAAEGPFLLVYHGQSLSFVLRQRIFQAQAIHGIVAQSKGIEHAEIVIWGGSFLRALKISLGPTSRGFDKLPENAVQLSPTAKASDWILDLASHPYSTEDDGENNDIVCAAVTAHNALLEVIITGTPSTNGSLDVVIAELTSSSKSILYSAHLIWHGPDLILIAAGTAFGEIIFWSWTRQSDADTSSRVHRVFLGHEGSIFGVRISPELQPLPDQKSQRLLASCSDDRTIRLWDLSSISLQEDGNLRLEGTNDIERTDHTGFSNASYDQDLASSACLAIGWGHLSRVWQVYFLDRESSSDTLCLRSTGEDATSRLWSLSRKDQALKEGVEPSFDLKLVETAALHIGKNIWSSDLHASPSDSCAVITGGADSKISSHPPGVIFGRRQASALSEYTVQNVFTMSEASSSALTTPSGSLQHKSSAKSEFIRSYAFIGSSSFLLTTNTGRVYIESAGATSNTADTGVISSSQALGQFDDLYGYSICASEPSMRVGFVAGARGTLYCHQSADSTLRKLLTIEGKVGSMFTTKIPVEPSLVVLLVPIMGQKEAQLFYVDIATAEAQVPRQVAVPISTLLTGSSITAMTYIRGIDGRDHLVIGFRRGTLAFYNVPCGRIGSRTDSSSLATIYRIIEHVHGKETITALSWVPSTNHDSGPFSALHGHIVSVGRNGSLVMHHVDLFINSVTLVHDLPLPFGPNIEGFHFHNDHLVVYGFSSTKFVAYDTTAEEEVMSVDTGGAHRSWAYQPNTAIEGGGTLVWTRASNMRVFKQNGSNHNVIRPGGHGREIKAVSISPASPNGPTRRLVATGAEDTDVKLFEYVDGDVYCRQTLRKHTTGIQHLQWSQDSEYLFSSGGCEEFYIWRIRHSNPDLGIQVICESVCMPESEHSDLRIMSFDIRKRDSSSGYIIALVFSDSTIRVYSYDQMAAVKWNALATGVYFTSCLTQCVFLSPTTLLTAGTDGHAVLWPLHDTVLRPHQSDTLPPTTLKWEQPARIHQSTSKTLDTYAINEETTLIISGGDDSSIAFLLVSAAQKAASYAYPPVIVVRAHASAVTACSILNHDGRIFVLTSGNDQWVRLWEVIVRTAHGAGEDPLEIRRVGRTKTNVADVSSMAVLECGDGAAKVMICGVGMEVVRVEWE
ncbi:WD domain-containing protein [Lophiotrema nucula]|uniref:WD domain-containing protein n=1 Tax=Lophiotrema nucula TaxID=690887 RepID=A0A6A5YGN5_9PLEO|nr:WD domain-containing protein [Lophiotrema nucula]